MKYTKQQIDANEKQIKFIFDNIEIVKKFDMKQSAKVVMLIEKQIAQNEKVQKRKSTKNNVIETKRVIIPNTEIVQPVYLTFEEQTAINEVIAEFGIDIDTAKEKFKELKRQFTKATIEDLQLKLAKELL